MTAFAFLLIFLLTACASAPRGVPVAVHDVARLTRGDVRLLLERDWNDTSSPVTLPSGRLAACRPEGCEIGWSRAELPVVDSGRPLMLVRNVKGHVDLPRESARSLLSLMDSARRLGRTISYHEEDGGVSCNGEECGLDLRIWVDEERGYSPRLQETTRLQTFVQGALSVVRGR